MQVKIAHGCLGSQNNFIDKKLKCVQGDIAGRLPALALREKYGIYLDLSVKESVA